MVARRIVRFTFPLVPNVQIVVVVEFGSAHAMRVKTTVCGTKGQNVLSKLTHVSTPEEVCVVLSHSVFRTCNFGPAQAAWHYVKYHLVSRDQGRSSKKGAEANLYRRPRRLTARQVASILLGCGDFNHCRSNEAREKILQFALTINKRFFDALDAYVEEDCTALDLSPAMGEDVLAALAEENLSVCPSLGGVPKFGQSGEGGRWA